MTLNIVMVEPQIPQNTGNVARTCAATGARLHLVGPMAFKIDDKKLKRAGLDYWHMLDISFYDDIADFFGMVSGGTLTIQSDTGDLNDTSFIAHPDALSTENSIATQTDYSDTSTIVRSETTPIILSNESSLTYPDTSSLNLYYFTTKAPHIYTEPEYKDDVYLIFGSETKGLDEALLYRNKEQCVRFPMIPGARSMNLSNSVAVGVFEVLRQWGFPHLQNYGKMVE